LQYSVDESPDKYVLLADVSAGGLRSVREVPLCAGRKIKKYITDSVEDAAAYAAACGDYLYIVLRLKSILLSERKALKSIPCVLSIALEPDAAAGGDAPVTRKKDFSAADLFKSYYRDRFGGEPDEKLLLLFMDILNEGEAYEAD
jgi:hypothetical protein